MTSIDWPYILVGCALGTLGWLLYWAGLPLIGAVMGASVGVSLGYLGSGVVTSAWGAPVMSALGGVLGALVGMFLVRSLQLYFFFASGASLGGALAWEALRSPLVSGLGASPQNLGGLLLIALGALGGGLLLISLRRFIVAVVTSLAGASLMSVGVADQYRVVVWIVSVVAFLSIQIGLVRRYVSVESFNRRTRRILANDDEPDRDDD